NSVVERWNRTLVEAAQTMLSAAKVPLFFWAENNLGESSYFVKNRTLVEAAQTMLSTAKVPLFFWAEAIATACFTQNRSLVIPRHEKTPYHIINDRKPSVKFFHIFGSLCYIVRDGENLDKMKEKDYVSSDPAPECQTMALEHDSLSTDLQCQENHAMCVLKSVAKPLKETVASESNKNPRNFTRKLYERVSKTCSWWYPKFTPSGYIWKPKSKKENVNPNLVQIVLFIVDSGCSKHMTGNLKLLINFVEKFLGTVKFGNDQIAPILGYGDLVQGAVTIKMFYYVEGLNHNLFSVGQFCDADLEVAFRKSTCFISDLKGNDLLTGSRGTDLYAITLQDTISPNPICLMAKATSSQAWLWHRRLSHLNFDTINLLSKNDIVVGLSKLKFVKDHLYSSCELGKAKRQSFHTKLTPSSKRRDGENLDKMQEKGDKCIFVGYSTQSRAYRVFNKRTRVIMESIHVNFNELPQMASDQISSDPAPECQTIALNHDSLSPAIQCQANVPQADRTVTMSKELDLLFSLMFDELLNGSSKVVSKSSVVSAADAPNQRQHHTTPLNSHTTPSPTYDEFINIFSTLVQDQWETSSRHVDSSNMHTFYQRYPS
nr:integrase, catalytic region, zinc finger, CCHC-type, peptidase aspartic, catalytic [Tanacetum cinerariifolium]